MSKQITELTREQEQVIERIAEVYGRTHVSVARSTVWVSTPDHKTRSIREDGLLGYAMDTQFDIDWEPRG